MSRVLVTGGAGFIPSNLIRHLLEHTTHEVISLDALTYAGNLENLADVMSHPRLEFVHGDIRDAGLVGEIVGGVDVIVNAAAESHVEKSILEGASEFVTTNVEGTQILLDAIRETPVERFLLISSSEVYGTAERDPMDEEHPLNPRSPYAATKAGGDRLAYSYRVTYGLPVVIVRPFNNYGAAPASREGRAPLHHPGARGRAAHDPRGRPREPRLAPRRRHGVGDRGADRRAARARRRRGGERRDRRRHLGERDRAARARRPSATRSATTVHVDERPGQVDRHIGSTDKLELLTGWRASIGFEEGLERTVAWYRENEAWWRGVLGRVGVSSS